VQNGDTPYPHCLITADSVLCLGGLGWPQNVAHLSSSGTLEWGPGTSLGGEQPVPLTAGQSYHWLGWTVRVNGSAMTFTNDATGHGMAVTNANAAPF
jgi:hypothetical protein